MGQVYQSRHKPWIRITAMFTDSTREFNVDTVDSAKWPGEQVTNAKSLYSKGPLSECCHDMIRCGCRWGCSSVAEVVAEFQGEVDAILVGASMHSVGLVSGWSRVLAMFTRTGFRISVLTEDVVK